MLLVVNDVVLFGGDVFEEGMCEILFDILGGWVYYYVYVLDGVIVVGYVILLVGIFSVFSGILELVYFNGEYLGWEV